VYDAVEVEHGRAERLLGVDDDEQRGVAPQHAYATAPIANERSR
jgi:hypothetical protein